MFHFFIFNGKYQRRITIFLLCITSWGLCWVLFKSETQHFSDRAHSSKLVQRSDSHCHVDSLKYELPLGSFTSFLYSCTLYIAMHCIAQPDNIHQQVSYIYFRNRMFVFQRFVHTCVPAQNCSLFMFLYWISVSRSSCRFVFRFVYVPILRRTCCQQST